MNGEERMSALQEEAEVYETLAAVFLELPTEETMAAALAVEAADAPEGSSLALLGQFATQNAARPVADVLEDVARDRVLLVRGMGTGSIVPPYESQYLSCEQGEAIGALNRFYGECGFRKQKEARDSADQIGVEFAFAAELVRREIGQLAAGEEAAAQETDGLLDRFFAEHLGLWAAAYAERVKDAARTDYWKAVASAVGEAMEVRAAPVSEA